MIPIPFSNIALSLSGGGYRATSFHLGAMAYLDAQEIEGDNLLRNVKIVSTISGGTLTGVMYAMKLAEGKGFQECFDKLYHLLDEDKLMELALDKLNHPDKWENKHKTRDLINAFAEVYNEEFYDQKTFALLFDSPKSHLSDIIFGASEFSFGIQFRFQEEEHGGRFGNHYVNLPENVAKEIRLADAAATSSCFPGGFEPMIMPNDFGNGPDSLVNETWFSKKYDDVSYKETAIMDGGIIDNQGIEGIKLAEKRHAKANDGNPFIGTYIVSDVSSEMMTPYKVPKFSYSALKNFITFNTVSGLLLILAAVLVYLIYYTLPLWGVIASSCALMLITLWFLALFISRGILKSAISSAYGNSKVPKFLQDFKVLRRTPIYILLYLIKFRITSVVKMVSDIFLRQIRRIQLNVLYDSPEWDYRFKSNYIFTLEKDMNLPEIMKKVINAANNMPTTLWFSEKEKEDGVLDDLIACGQLTMCRNLIQYTKRLKNEEYMDRIWNKLSPEKQAAIEDLQGAMENDWERFKHDPYWLLKKNKNHVHA